MHDMEAGVTLHDARLAQLRRGTLQYCVLALLADDERYVVELVRALAQVEGMEAGEGTLYPLLSRLRREGLVESVWRESPSGPPRRYYQLTTKGRRSLNAFAGEWNRFRDAVDGILAGRTDERRPRRTRRAGLSVAAEP